MTLKACIYKNCDNYINLRDRTFNEHITLFNFPKNPVRRQIWIENGRAPPNLSPTMYCYCSDHFDKRFLATNNRRTALVGEAVPFPYVDQEIDENFDDDDNLDCYLYEMKEDGHGSSSGELIEQEPLQEQDIHVESTTSMQGEDQAEIELINNEFNVEHTPESVSNQYIMHMASVKETKDSNKALLNSLKRKLNDSSVTLTPASSSKQMTLKKSSPTNQQQSPKTLDHKSNTKIKTMTVAPADVNILNINQQADHVVGSVVKEPEIDPDSLVDTQHVTTFIFKGEEYVQMPRDHYIKEKIDLMKKLDKMERVVKAIKGHLNSLEI